MQRSHERFGVQDAGFRREERGNRGHVRLPLAAERAIDDGEPFDAIGHASCEQLLELRDLGLMVRDDQLAAALMWHAMVCAELVEKATTLDAEPRLERAG